jgi:hypothetical protein
MFSKNNVWFCEAIVGRAWHQHEPLKHLAIDIFDFDVFRFILSDEVLLQASVCGKSDILQYLVHRSKIVHYTTDEYRDEDDDDMRSSDNESKIASITNKVSLYVDIFCIFESQICSYIFRMHEQLRNIKDFVLELPEYPCELIKTISEGNHQICKDLCKKVLTESEDLKSFLDELSPEQSTVWREQLEKSFEYRLKSDDEELLEFLEEYM